MDVCNELTAQLWFNFGNNRESPGFMAVGREVCRGLGLVDIESTRDRSLVKDCQERTPNFGNVLKSQGQYKSRLDFDLNCILSDGRNVGCDNSGRV